jgi:hypothetical protein
MQHIRELESLVATLRNASMQIIHWYQEETTCKDLKSQQNEKSSRKNWIRKSKTKANIFTKKKLRKTQDNLK